LELEIVSGVLSCGPQMSGITPIKPPSKAASTPSVPAPTIMHYDNYRLYLKDWFEWKKTQTSNYSGAIFARMAGMQSHTLLGMVMRGERSLSAASVRAFVKAMQLNPKDAMIFERLVFFNQSDNSEDRAFYLEQIVQLTKGKGKGLLQQLHQYGQYLSHWYVVAIRELVSLKDFQQEAEWISKRLKGAVSKKQVEEAWQILLDLQLVSWNAKTKAWETLHPHIDIDIQEVDHAIRNYQKEYLTMAYEAIDSGNREDRDFSNLTLSIRTTDIPKLKERLSEFRKNINLDFACSEGNADEVVALNVQLLVLTESSKRKDKSS